MKDLNKEREAFEYWADAKCYYLDKREDGGYEKGSTALAWEIAQYFMAVGRDQGVEKAKAQAVPEGYVVVPKELDKNAALKMAKARILYPSSTKDPVWSEIATQAYKDAIESEKCRLIRDYKEMVGLASESGAEG